MELNDMSASSPVHLRVENIIIIKTQTLYSTLVGKSVLK
jgi:hypothetical protein